MRDYICRKKFEAMGGEFEFSCFPQNFKTMEEVYLLFDRGMDEVKRIQEKFTDHKPSYFNRINESAGISPTKVDQETISLLNMAIDASKKSDGLFDISFAVLGQIWREGGLTPEVIEEKRPFINYQMIEIDEESNEVYLPHKEMRLGLGGIGKGYAIDCVYDLFQKEGLYNFFINGAGDIRVHARADAPRAWKIAIRNPLSVNSAKSIGVIELRNGAVASSGGYIHNIDGDLFNNHIINPKTGKSSDEIIATTVLAEDAISADLTATILMLLDLQRGLLYLDHHNLSGIIIDKTGRSHLSKRAMSQFFKKLEVAN